MTTFTLRHGDCLEVMRGMADASVDAIVTDPPYGIRFMGMAWDDPDIIARTEQRRSMRSHAPGAGPNGGHKSIAAEAGKYDLSPAAMRAFQDWTAAWCREAMRVLKPGGHMLVFASARTYHRMVCGVEEAGFEIRDQIMWLYGSGFPKSLDVSKAIDKAAGAEREVVGVRSSFRPSANATRNPEGFQDRSDGTITAPATDAARQWSGWGTALKPAHEPICVARKPLDGTVAQNVLAHGTGALNIDACRIPTNEVLRAGAGGIPCRNDPMVPRGRSGEASAARRYTDAGATNFAPTPGPRGGDAAGRWPANVIHDGSAEVVAAFPQASGAQSAVKGTEASAKTANTFGEFGVRAPSDRRDGGGSAARFFYAAKASRADRNAGCEAMESKPLNWSSGTQNPGSFQSEGTNRNSQNHHPTVKPTDLMAYLCRLVTPPGGVVLDPFMGSGSTGKACMREGFSFVGIELSAEYLAIAQARIEHELAAATAAQAAAFNPQLGLFGEAA